MIQPFDTDYDNCYSLLLFTQRQIGNLQQYIYLKYNFVGTPRKFIVVNKLTIINLRGVTTKLFFNLISTMQTDKELSTFTC